jgi:DNA-binding NarL/FixJ family response regulator
VLFKCLHRVVAGDFWVGLRERVSDVVMSLRKLKIARRRSRAFGLTEREVEIARAAVAGYTNKEFARRSSINENTVRSK